MATARKAKKPIIHFGVKGQKKFVSVLCCFLLHQLTYSHTPLTHGSRPFKSFVQSFDTWCSDNVGTRLVNGFLARGKNSKTELHKAFPFHIGGQLE